EDKYIFKFLLLSHTLGFLNSGNIWFSKASELGDKLECILIDDLNESPLDRESIEACKEKTLISCWHLEKWDHLLCGMSIQNRKWTEGFVQFDSNEKLSTT